MRQAGGSIRKQYNDLQGLWREIDFLRPNPMKCADDIQKYNLILKVTEKLNCVVLIYPIFCLFQDILTEKIGRDTMKGGLYYMDDFSCGKANAVKDRFGFSYVKYLFSNLHVSNFKCETCILAKSNCVPFSISLNKCDVPSALIHSDVLKTIPDHYFI